MPKRVSAEAKRVALNCLVLPETKRFLGEQKCSQGEAVDRAVAALRMRDAQGRVTEETGDPWKSVSVNPAVKRALEPQTWKRGPRPKGDKSR